MQGPDARSYTCAHDSSQQQNNAEATGELDVAITAISNVILHSID